MHDTITRLFLWSAALLLLATEPTGKCAPRQQATRILEAWKRGEVDVGTAREWVASADVIATSEFVEALAGHLDKDPAYTGLLVGLLPVLGAKGPSATPLVPWIVRILKDPPVPADRYGPAREAEARAIRGAAAEALAQIVGLENYPACIGQLPLDLRCQCVTVAAAYANRAALAVMPDEVREYYRRAVLECLSSNDPFVRGNVPTALSVFYGSDLYITKNGQRQLNPRVAQALQDVSRTHPDERWRAYISRLYRTLARGAQPATSQPTQLAPDPRERLRRWVRHRYAAMTHQQRSRIEPIQWWDTIIQQLPSADLDPRGAAWFRQSFARWVEWPGYELLQTHRRQSSAPLYPAELIARCTAASTSAVLATTPGAARSASVARIIAAWKRVLLRRASALRLKTSRAKTDAAARSQAHLASAYSYPMLRQRIEMLFNSILFERAAANVLQRKPDWERAIEMMLKRIPLSQRRLTLSQLDLLGSWVVEAAFFHASQLPCARPLERVAIQQAREILTPPMPDTQPTPRSP